MMWQKTIMIWAGLLFIIVYFFVLFCFVSFRVLFVSLFLLLSKVEDLNRFSIFSNNNVLSQGACIFAAVSIHYFYLVGFAWMLIEGIYLYLKVVRVFNILVKMEIFYGFSWGMYKPLFGSLLYNLLHFMTKLSMRKRKQTAVTNITITFRMVCLTWRFVCYNIHPQRWRLQNMTRSKKTKTKAR